MPPNDENDKARVEIEVALRDSFSSAMKSITRELDNANRKALELGGGGAKGFTQLNEGVKTTSRSMEVLNATTMVLSRAFIGPVGLAAGLYQVSTMLEKVAVSSLQMRNFATNTGFSTQAVKELQQAGRRMGMTLQESTAAIESLGSKLDNLEAFKEGSELYQALSRGPGGVEFAKRIEEVAKSGDRIKVVGEITATYGRQSDRAKTLIAGLFGVQKSYFEFLAEARSHNIKVFEFPEAESKKFMEYSIAFEVKLDEIWKRVAAHGITAMNELSKALEGEGITAKQIADTLNAGVDIVLAGIRHNISDVKNMIEDITTLLNSFSKIPENFRQATGIGQGLPEGDVNPAAGAGDLGFNKPGIQFLKPLPFKNLNNPFKNPNNGGGITDFGGMRRSGDEDGVNLLTDIRDTLQRMELKEGGSGRTSDESTAGGGRQTLGRRVGIDSGGSGVGARGSDGVNGDGRTRGDRNNNPGNMKFGPLAKAFGATGADDKGFAIFPDSTSGSEAHSALLKSDRYKGLTLDQFGDKYAEGSDSWKKTVGGVLGIKGGDIVDNQNPALMGAIRKAEGTGRGGGEAGSGFGVPSNVLAEARKVVAAGGGAEGAKRYIESKGFSVSSAWCGDFAASVVSAAGGKPPRNYSVASNWRNFGQPAEGDPQGGDIAVRKGPRTGATGSHVTIVDQFDPETGQFKGIGGNQGRAGMRATYSMDRFDFRRGDDRAAIDKAQSAAGGRNGSIKASVDFNNVPPGVKTNADVEGDVFKELQIKKTKQGGVYREMDQAYE